MFQKHAKKNFAEALPRLCCPCTVRPPLCWLRSPSEWKEVDNPQLESRNEPGTLKWTFN